MDEQLREVFAANLRYYMEKAGKTQADLIRYMGISSATASDWVNGRKMPRADKLQAIASWLGIRISLLMEEQAESPQQYYLNPETAEIAQDIFENKELRMLFSVGRDMDPEDLKALHNMALALKRKEGYDGDDPA